VLRIHASGGTDIYAALAEADSAMRSLSTPIRHVILLSDGETGPANFEALAARMGAEGITVSTITLLQGNFDLSLMKSIAERGKGRYLWASDPRTLPQLFTSEVRQIVGEPKAGTTPPVVEPENPPPPLTDPPNTSKGAQTPFKPVARGIHESIQGIDFKDAPELQGMLRGKAKQSSLVPLVDNREERPVLAFWRFGLGKVAVWTPDFGSEWSRGFAAWPGANKLMAQVVRAISSNLRSSSLYNRIRLKQQGTEATISVDAQELSAQITRPSIQPLEPRREKERLVVSVPLTDPGQAYHLTLRSGEETALIGMVGPVPEELRQVGLNRRMFAPDARPPESLFLADAPPTPRRRDLSPWLLLSAAVLVTLDVMIRRFRL
jgi:hypothetical protein